MRIAAIRRPSGDHAGPSKSSRPLVILRADEPFRVYRKAMKRRDGEPELLRALVGAEATTLVDLDQARRRGVTSEQ